MCEMDCGVLEIGGRSVGAVVLMLGKTRRRGEGAREIVGENEVFFGSWPG